MTRGRFLAGAAGAAAGAAGIYEVVDRFATSPARPLAAPHADEQHLLSHTEVVEVDGVEVLVPPIHHQVTTATIPADVDLANARPELEHVLRKLEAQYDATPEGLGVTIAWGVPYFVERVPRQTNAHMPIDLRESTTRRVVPALVDSIRFPSDPDDTVLERNDVAILLRSDDLSHVADGHRTLFDELGLFRPTSVRRGFVGGGFSGRRSLPKQMALAAGIPGAELIPETAQLFLGFTSTQKQAIGPSRIANFETLGFADLRSGYFRGGTAMHLSHVHEDLERWYQSRDFDLRVAATFRPGLAVEEGNQTVRQAPDDISDGTRVARDYLASGGSIGHSASIQPFSRLPPGGIVGVDGTFYPGGSAIPQRADFNTLDNPFFWSADEERDRWSDEAAAGLHFISFNPTSSDFHRNRLAMDGQLPNGTRLRFERRSPLQGFNDVLRTTHRQNFLVPPRRHRSFPLSELRA